ncbi:Uncharacterised protein [uncultured archaeon]|nr:Uncharacterised protein [uncultured archaeon]
MHPINIIFLIAQAFLGTASIYWLLANAITIGLVFMFALYLITFIQMVFNNATHKRKVA